MNDDIDEGGAGRLDDEQEDLFDLDPELEEFDEINKAYHPRAAPMAGRPRLVFVERGG
jgi:hypothetical protein